MSVLSLDIRLARRGFELSLTHDFAAHGITALFGRSGAGKSSVLRIIAGLERSSGGVVRFEDQLWQGANRFVAPHRRGVGMVFQDTRLFAHLTVAGNLRYARKRAPGTASAAGFDTVAQALRIGALLDRWPASLSGGERQRVAIARTLLSRPRLLLLDEPLAALDLKARAEILPLIARLPGMFGLPVIHVTHSVEEITQLADRMVVLSEGRMIAAGGVAECLERADILPATGRFEAGAVLEARVRCHDPRLHMTCVAVGEQMLEMPGVDLPDGEAIRLRIRARDVSLALSRPERISIRNVLKGHVAELRTEPGTAFAEALIDIGAGRIRARITRAAVEALNLREAMPVFALVKSVSFERPIAAARSAPP